MTQGNQSKWWHPLLELVKHVFPGVGVFLLLAIPVIALDFFNQGLELVEFQRADTQAIRISNLVKWILHAVEYFILAVDVVFVVATLGNGMWQYLISLSWKKSDKVE